MDGGGSGSGGSSMFASGSSDHLTSFIQNPPSSSSSSSPSQVLESLWVPDSSPFHEPSSMVYFESSLAPPAKPDSVPGGSRRRIRRPTDGGCEGGEEEETSEEGSYEGRVVVVAGKKRRLSPEQVQFLERSFEVENKLEPERKTRLARELGLEPRQVAIWFQNRRARFKTKQLERDFEGLKSSYNKLTVDYESLVEEKEKLKNEVAILTAKLKQREGEKSNSGSSPLNGIAHLNRLEPKSATPAAAVEVEAEAEAAAVPCKQEAAAASSAKSDVLDLESPHCPAEEGNYSSALETSQRYEPNHSDFSQDEEDIHLTRSLLAPASYYGFHEQQGSSCGFGLLSGAEMENEDPPPPSPYWSCWMY